MYKYIDTYSLGYYVSTSKGNWFNRDIIEIYEAQEE